MTFHSMKTGNDPWVRGPLPYREEGGVRDAIHAAAVRRWGEFSPAVWVDPEGCINLKMRQCCGESIPALIAWLRMACEAEAARGVDE